MRERNGEQEREREERVMETGEKVRDTGTGRENEIRRGRTREKESYTERDKERK